MRAQKRDKNEREIIEALEKAGALVCMLVLPVDLLVLFRNRWHLMEIKGPVGRLTPYQVNFIRQAGESNVHVVRTPEEAINALLGAN